MEDIADLLKEYLALEEVITNIRLITGRSYEQVEADIRELSATSTKSYLDAAIHMYMQAVMNSKGETMPQDHMAVVDRPRFCKKCNRTTTQRLVIYKDADYWTCLRPDCGYKESTDYTEIKEVTGLTKKEIDRIRRNLMGIVGDLQTRRWSKGMGDKDKSFIQRIIERLLGIGRDLDYGDDDED